MSPKFEINKKDLKEHAKLDGGKYQKASSLQKVQRQLIKSENGRGGYSQENEYRYYKYTLKMQSYASFNKVIYSCNFEDSLNLALSK